VLVLRMLVSEFKLFGALMNVSEIGEDLVRIHSSFGVFLRLILIYGRFEISGFTDEVRDYSYRV
jgi:hypothetical protein